MVESNLFRIKTHQTRVDELGACNRSWLLLPLPAAVCPLHMCVLSGRLPVGNGVPFRWLTAIDCSQLHCYRKPFFLLLCPLWFVSLSLSIFKSLDNLNRPPPRSSPFFVIQTNFCCFCCRRRFCRHNTRVHCGFCSVVVQYAYRTVWI